jgi:hypothetical protein
METKRMRKMDRVRAMFDAGMDTVEISKVLGFSEAQTSALLYRSRCKERGLPCDAKRRLAPKMNSILWREERLAMDTVQFKWNRLRTLAERT